MGIGYQELLLILLIVLVIFGGRKIPELARGLGRGIREFRKARDGTGDKTEKSDTETANGDSKPAATASAPAKNPKPDGDSKPPAAR
ncbi:MAG: hypothetical protein A3K19_30705 [Lentisphaerae bacterium RIFOXYB12_FULL_65_16]|nr:MAG: hypothetical protein A3K18_01065 [Lentisphaerae bacterium RIFOXYA12_64_32]OGV88789.1 MAG: hypothetical protein A3K19_30705 [Lentisphaerae bacterium RIFOXYB12_FULL_65_16]